MSKVMKIYLLGFIMLTGLVLILLCFQHGISGNDFWWHIKVGEWICNHGEIPQTDIFSWYGMERNLEWDAHEWLSQVLFWKMYSFGGEGLVFGFCVTAAILMTFLLIRRATPYCYKNIGISIVFFGAFSIITSLFFYGRPHVFGFFLLYAELECLYAFWKKGRDYMLYFIPIIGVLWSNMHGGSAMLSYTLCLVVLICSLINGSWGRIYSVRLERKRIMRLAIVTMLTIGSIMVNPAGIRMLTYPYWNMNNDLMLLISEWASPDVKKIDNLVLFFIPVFVVLFGMLFSNKKIELQDLVLCLLFLFLFLRSRRFVVLLFIALPFVAFPYVLECKVKEIKGKWEHAMVGILLLALISQTILSGISIGKKIQSDKIISQVLEEEVIELLKEQKPEKLYNDFNFGESLIYHNIPVFFDSRVDLYVKDGSFADGMSLMTLMKYNEKITTTYVDVEGIINKYGFDAFLIMPDRPLYIYLKSLPEQYDLLYETEEVAYFEEARK